MVVKEVELKAQLYIFNINFVSGISLHKLGCSLLLDPIIIVFIPDTLTADLSASGCGVILSEVNIKG